MEIRIYIFATLEQADELSRQRTAQILSNTKRDLEAAFESAEKAKITVELKEELL